MWLFLQRMLSVRILTDVNMLMHVNMGSDLVGLIAAPALAGRAGRSH